MVIQILKFEHLLVNLLVLFSEINCFMEFYTCEQDANQLKDSPLKNYDCDNLHKTYIQQM